MEDGKKIPPKLTKTKQPVKTEWGAQCVVFTYFQGDINSEVDEHFSRALSMAKNPQDLSRKNSSEDGAVKNERCTPPHQWNVSPPWAKPYQMPSPLNLSSTDHIAPASATDMYQPSCLQGIPPLATEFWHLPLSGNPNLTVAPDYPLPAPELHMAQRCVLDGKCGSLLGLLQQEPCPPSVREPPDSGSACLTSSGRLQNMSQSLTSGADIPAADRRRDLYF